MNTDSRQYTVSSPYDDLYIYYLKGHLLSDNLRPLKNYIGDWQEEDFSFLFFSHPSRSIVAGLIETQPDVSLIDDYHMTYEQWHGGVFQPCRIGSFTIIPSWQYGKAKQPLQPTSHQIVLDPGVVFGTGLHPTTQDCLHALESVFEADAIQSVVDLGTGTGLLALAAARMGSGSTLAVDNNLLAARTARQNVDLNHLNEKVLVVQGSAENFINRPTHLLVANVHFDVVLKIIRSDEFFHHKYFILSGLMRSQAKELMSFLSTRPVRILSQWSHKHIWYTYLGKNL